MKTWGVNIMRTGLVVGVIEGVVLDPSPPNRAAITIAVRADRDHPPALQSFITPPQVTPEAFDRLMQGLTLLCQREVILHFYVQCGWGIMPDTRVVTGVTPAGLTSPEPTHETKA